mmetsp:Transcript_17714/g.49577  ORF Transcript_17714/g.49577 Transcript_17714/m.49577 type:complete len:671 (-) Transcript_17714:529-2541(-)
MDVKGKAPMDPGPSTSVAFDEGESSDGRGGGVRWGMGPSSISAMEEPAPGPAGIEIQAEDQPDGGTKTPIIKAATAGKSKGKSKAWGKLKLAKNMNTVKGNLSNMTEELREEAKRNTKLRMLAMKKMEERNRMFTTGAMEYTAMEYLPDLDREKLGRLGSPGTHAVGSTKAQIDPLQRKQHLVFAALRGRAPKVEKHSDEWLANDAVDNLTLEVALEETAEIITGKDGKLRKTYGGLGTAVDHAMTELKKDFLGRTVRPWKTLSREERWWNVTSWMYMALDLVAITFFCYYAFVLFQNDRRMDPLAWQLTFGSTAVFIGLHTLVLLLEFTDYFSVYVVMVGILVCGLFYGAVFYFLEIYLGEFTCFHYTGIERHAFGICYEGRLLVGMMLGVMYLLLAVLYQWQWRNHKRLQRKKRGDYAEELDLEELLERVDTKFEKYRLMETGQIGTQLWGKTNMSFMTDRSPGAISTVSRGVFDTTTSSKGGTLRSSKASSGKQTFVTRLMNVKPGTGANTTSTTLRGVPHVRPSSPDEPTGPSLAVSRFTQPPGGTIFPQPSSTFHNTKMLARRTSVTVQTPVSGADEDMDVDRLKLALGDSKYRTKQVRPHLYDPNADRTTTVGVREAAGGGDGPIIAPVYNTTTSLGLRASQTMNSLSNQTSKHQRNRVLNKAN